MKITFIDHSSFFVELESCALLFDYWKGEIPAVDKKLYVFASHAHNDHYNPSVLDLAENRDVTYIFSKDIRAKRPDRKIIFMKAGEIINTGEISVEALNSTDCGAAFIVSCEGKNIFHAGDLNLWLWKGETKAYNNNMRALFEKYISPLKGRSFDAGFIPLDPRQGEYYSLGMDRFLETADFKAVFPMHFWSRFDLIDKYKKEHPDYADKIIRIAQRGYFTEV